MNELQMKVFAPLALRVISSPTQTEEVETPALISGLLFTVTATDALLLQLLVVVPTTTKVLLTCGDTVSCGLIPPVVQL